MMSGAISIPVAFLALFYWKDTPGKAFAILAGIGFLGFAIGLVRKNRALVHQNRPILEPKLVIDRIRSKRLLFHFEVKNIGPAAAEDIEYQEKMEGYWSNIGSKMPRQQNLWVVSGSGSRPNV